MTQPDPVELDHRIVDALAECHTPPSRDQLYRLLEAWRDIFRGDTPDPAAAELVEYAGARDWGAPEQPKWEFIRDDGSFYERIAPELIPDSDAVDSRSIVDDGMPL